MSVSLLSYLHCRKDAELTLDAELKRLADASKLEPGCLSYELYQYKDDSLNYVIEEEWEDDDRLASHMESPHYKSFVRVCPALLEQAADVKILTRLV